MQPPPLPAMADAAPTERTITLAWDRSPDTNVVGYYLYWGRAAGTYTNKLYGTGLTNSVRLSVPPTVYFAATATDGLLESDFSNEVRYPLEIPQYVNVLLYEWATNVAGPWEYGGLVNTDTNLLPTKFYRLRIVRTPVVQ